MASRKSTRRSDTSRRHTKWKDLPSTLTGARLTAPTGWPVAGALRGRFGYP